jgi:hypothetical protein
MLLAIHRDNEAMDWEETLYHNLTIPRSRNVINHRGDPVQA